MAIKTNLSRILGERRIKQLELAKLTGLQYNTVNAIYHDKWKQIGRKTLEKICRVLDVAIGDLLELSGNDDG